MPLTPEERDQAIANTLLTIWRILSSQKIALIPMDKLIRAEWAIRTLPPELLDAVCKEVEKRMKVKNDSPGKF